MQTMYSVHLVCKILCEPVYAAVKIIRSIILN